MRHYSFPLLLTVVYTLLLLSPAFGQEPSTFNHHQSLEFGTGITPNWVVSTISTKKKSSSASTESSIFPPAIYGAYTLGLNESWDFTAQIGFKGLQNSKLEIEEEWDPYSNYNYRYTDSFLFRMNALTVGTDFKKFRYGGHGKGLYLSIGAGMTFVGSKITPIFTTVKSETTNTSNAFVITTTETGNSWTQNSMTGSLSGGIGGHIHLFEAYYLDIGARATYHFLTNKDALRDLDYHSDPNKMDKDTYDYPSEFSGVVKSMARINSFRSYYLEVYVKIGLPL